MSPHLILFETENLTLCTWQLTDLFVLQSPGMRGEMGKDELYSKHGLYCVFTAKRKPMGDAGSLDRCLDCIEL